MWANRRGRYHYRQLSEKQINPPRPTPPFLSSAPRTGSFLPKRMRTFIGVDASCQSNIRRMQDWHWKWWGNPHAYIYQLIKQQSQGDSDFFFLLSILLMPSPWNPSSFHLKGFYISCLSWPGYTCLTPSPSAERSHFQAPSPGRGGGGMPAPRQTDHEVAPPEQLTN